MKLNLLARAAILLCAADSLVETPSIEFAPADAGDFELLTDSKDGVLRVKQKATRADSRNKNRRVYPRAVLQAAIDAARPTAKAGAMLCEYIHPDVAKTKLQLPCPVFSLFRLAISDSGTGISRSL